VGPLVRQDDMKDGQGNTVLFSENLQASPWHRLVAGTSDANSISFISTVTGTSPNIQAAANRQGQLTQGFVWHYRDMKSKNFNGSVSVNATTPFAVLEINQGLDGQDIYLTDMDPGNAHRVARPSSAHADGVNMGFADGASKFISQQIDYRVYQALMTPRGKSSDVPFREFIPEGEAL